jgi:hypothetical protein
MKPRAEWFSIDSQGEFWIYGIPGTDIDFACIYRAGALDKNLDWNVYWIAVKRGTGTDNVRKRFTTIQKSAKWCLK